MNKRNVNKGQQRSIRAIEGTKSRKGNGYLRSQMKSSKLQARLEIRPRLSWGSYVYWDEETNRMQEWNSGSPMRYWKRFSNRKVRNTNDVTNHNGYRRVFDLEGLW